MSDIDEIFELLLDKQEINREQLLEIFARCNSYIIGFDDKNISEYLEENILDLIASHLRFTDKYIFQTQWKHFTEQRIFSEYL